MAIQAIESVLPTQVRSLHFDGLICASFPDCDAVIATAEAKMLETYGYYVTFAAQPLGNPNDSDLFREWLTAKTQRDPAIPCRDDMSECTSTASAIALRVGCRGDVDWFFGNCWAFRTHIHPVDIVDSMGGVSMCLPRALCKLSPSSFYNIGRFMACFDGPVAFSEMTPMGFSFKLSNGICTYRPQLIVVGNHAVGISTFGDLVRIRDSEIHRSFSLNRESFESLARMAGMAILNVY